MTQPKRVNPLFSGFGCGTAILMVLGLAVILYLQGGIPFSPGRLTANANAAPINNFASHAEFEGDCSQCHDAWRGISTDRCETCHTTTKQERETSVGLHGRFTGAEQCQTCHTDHQGHEANITQLAANHFDHNRSTLFTLAKHQTNADNTPITCQDCHMPNSYSPEFVDCTTCHTALEAAFMAAHETQFGNDCLACHDGVDRLAQFDHDLFFVLDGAHQTTACEDCHQARTFQATPRECGQCHAEPELHAGQFGLDCVRCHTTTTWEHAQLTLHTFPINHGESNNSCDTCHSQSYAEYTCYTCHEHTPTEMREKHLEEGLADFENCIECHPTGQEDEV
jgi:hypothetical protein